MAQFPDTSWSGIQAAADGERAALGNVFKDYYGPLVEFATRVLQLSPHAAEASVADYFSDLVVEGNLLRAASPSRGRFRTLLKVALRNYLHSQRRRAENRPMSSPDDLRLEDIAEKGSEQPDAFDRLWAITVLVEALAAWQAECLAHRSPHWNLFLRREVEPAFASHSPPSYEEIYAELGYPTAKHALNAMVTVRRSIRRHLHDVLERRVRYGKPLEVLLQNAVPKRATHETNSESNQPTPCGADTDTRVEELWNELCSVLLKCRRAPEERAHPATHHGNPLRKLFETLLASQDTAGTAIVSWHMASWADLKDTELTRLAQLLMGDQNDAPQNHPEREMASALEHLLNVPLRELLKSVPAFVDWSSSFDESEDSALCRTVRELLSAPAPSLRLLQLVKDYAKNCRATPNTKIPADIASALYFLSVSSSVLAHDRTLSQLPIEALREGIRWLAAQPWVAPAEKLLAERAFEKMRKD